MRFSLIADDYSLSPAVSAGIREALAAGRVSGTGCMTTRPAWPQAARDLKLLDVDADIGLHFNLTLGAPLTAMPLLAPQGILPPIATLMRLSRQNALPLGEIAAELSAQLDAFMAGMGHEPHFLDGHQHVQMLPGIQDIVLEELKRRKLMGRLWLRSSADYPWRALWRGLSLPKALGIAWIGRGFAAKARRARFAVNDGFSGFSDFNPQHEYARIFERSLSAPGKRHLVMCHPGHVDDELRALDPTTITREQELAFLLSSDFSAILQKHQAKLVRFALSEPHLHTSRPHIPN